MRICKVEGCERKHYGLGYCRRHHNQMKKHGKIKGNPSVSYRDPNEIIVKGGICEIVLRDVWGNSYAKAIVDYVDYNLVKDHIWCKDAEGYLSTTINGKSVRFHKFIFPDVSSDHKNRNRLDNRRENLRFCTPSQNMMNTPRRSDNTTGFKGVCFVRRKPPLRNPYVATIGVNGKSVYLGYFEKAVDAAKVYNKAAIDIFGEFASINHNLTLRRIL